MRRRGPSAAAVLALAVAVCAAGLAAAAPARAAPPAPERLRVLGGEGWRPQNSWEVHWDLPAEGDPVAAVHYAVRDPQGALVVPPTRIDWPARSIAGLSVPALPGTFFLGVWFEDASGEQGPASTATLRYDSEPPGNAALRPLPEWIGRNAFPYTLRIQPPSPPHPVSGVLGYAISIDGSPDGEPCAQTYCREDEVDLRGGLDGTDHTVPGLPEGTHHVHVAAVSGAGVRSRATARGVLRVDTTFPTTELAGVPAGWANRPVTLSAIAVDPAGAGGAAPSGVSRTVIRVGERAPVVAAGDRATTTILESGVHRVVHYARDAAGNVGDGASANGRRNPAPLAATVMIDRTPPRVAFRSWQDPGDPELISAVVADGPSGPSAARGVIGFRAAGSGSGFASLPTAIRDGRLLARWDSGSVPPGDYEFRAVGFDAAGNSASTRSREDGSPMVLTAPLKPPTELLAGFGGERLVWPRCVRRGRARRCRRVTVLDFARRPRRRTVPFRRRVRFGGRLSTRAGTPLPGAQVRILERFEGGLPPRLSTATTDGRGRFAILLGAGPSRVVRASFGGTLRVGAAAAPAVRLGVRGRVRMRASASSAAVGGRPVVFSGRVVAPPGQLPPEGKSISLQFRLPGREWEEFRALRADRAGRFRLPYRFADDDSRGVRFQFRAYAPAQQGWPYEPAGSRPVFVRGR